ncbi:MAG: flagellar basal body L-ring protein [Chlorobiaceae bacterium]|nr:flagellar basal body L-ring protein [Chlorobiaceae bacterium]MBA4309103.1 flagellar basal body L-ring protein [Chlorobiaceae bacterium]
MKKKIINLVTLLIIFGTVSYTQDMRQNSMNSLFSDQKASRVGDAITILVVESSQASNNSETSGSRESNLSLGVSGGVGTTPIPNVDGRIATGNDFQGSGGTRTVGLIRTKISATIDSVLANGNLVIRGSRKISINSEEQLVSIRGIVRTADITSDNSVYSYNISEAEIIFEGSGMIDSMQKPGWLSRVFHWIF